MKILVTGGAGFIGSFLVDELVKKGHSVRIFDSLDPQVHPNGNKPDYLNPDAEFIQGDMRDYDAVKSAIQNCEVIFHEAAAVGVGQSQYMISHYVSANTMGTANLLDCIVNTKNSVRKMIVAASMSSYGEGLYQCGGCHKKMKPVLRTEEQMASGQWECICPDCSENLIPVGTTEDTPQECNSIYAITKKDQEDMVLNIGKSYSIPAVALRYFNVYGPRQSLSNPYTGVAAIFMSRIKNGNRPVVYEDGCQTRDFVSVHDIVRANLFVMENEEANYQSFNIGNDNPLKIKDIALSISKLYGKDIEPDITCKFRKGDVRHCFADISRIKNLGFVPKTDFQTGMKELIEWARKAAAVDKFEEANKELKQRGLV